MDAGHRRQRYPADIRQAAVRADLRVVAFGQQGEDHLQSGGRCQVTGAGLRRAKRRYSTDLDIELPGPVKLHVARGVHDVHVRGSGDVCKGGRQAIGHQEPSAPVASRRALELQERVVQSRAVEMTLHLVHIVQSPERPRQDQSAVRWARMD